MEIIVKTFQELHPLELYHLLQLRIEVFVVEQNCPYQDLDGKDLHAHQVMGYQDGKIVAITRVLPPGISYDHYCSIGRVATALPIRRSGAGKTITQASIDLCGRLYPGVSIKISAQSYLLDFYQSFGFEKTGDEYLEDNIPHHAMIRPARTNVQPIE